MNLEKLFKTQKILDEKIVKEKGLEGQDLLDKKILSLQVELGELANEWRGFKFWSNNQKPNNNANKEICSCCGGSGYPDGVPSYTEIDCWECDGKGYVSNNPLLEEYVDCLHFILSIGNDLESNDVEPYLVSVNKPIEMFSLMFSFVEKLSVNKDNHEYYRFYYSETLSRFLGLGKSLGFTWEQIEQAYYDKNKINHERQVNGY